MLVIIYGDDHILNQKNKQNKNIKTNQILHMIDNELDIDNYYIPSKNMIILKL